MANLYLKTFGGLQILHDGISINKSFKSDKIRALLLVLASTPSGILREKLMGLFWPDYPEKSARQSLRQSLYTIRKVLGQAGIPENCLLSNTDSVQLLLDENLWDGDFLKIDRAANQIKSHKHQTVRNCPDCITSLEDAMKTYDGDYLSGLATDSIEFENWLSHRQSQYKKTILVWLEHLEYWFASRMEFSSAATWAATNYELSGTYDEKLLRDLIWLQHLSSNRQAALREHESYVSRIRAEFDVAPEPTTTSLAEEIRNFPLPRTHNFSVSDRPFIGRVQEIEQILSSIRNGKRIISLVATGGTGKTRLAIQAGIRILYEQQMCVFLVQVSDLQPHESLDHALGNALQMKFTMCPSTIDQVVNQLNTLRTPVLILDGCENKVEACHRFVVDILARCPEVVFMLTSRVSLGFDKPDAYSFSIANFQNQPNFNSKDIILQHLPLRNSIEFFIGQLANTLDSFNITNLTAPLIAELCDKLRGLPLAMEIVCGQSVLYSIQELHKQVMEILGDLSEDNAARIIDITLAWGYNLLSSDEKEIVRKLSVFATGAKHEALSALISTEKLISLEHLSKKHWLVFDADLQQYRLQDTIRDFAKHYLVNNGEEESFSVQYVHYYRNLAAAHSPKLSTALVGNSLKELRQEKSNFEVALAYSLAFQNGDMSHYLVGNLALFWGLTGYFWEGLAWYDKVLAREASVDPQIASLNGFAMLSLMMGELKRARDNFEKALFLISNSEDIEQKLRIWLNLASTYARLNESEHAHSNFQALIQSARKSGQRNILAVAIMNYANFQLANGAQDLDDIEKLYEEGLSIIQSSGDRVKIASIFNNLGVIKRQKGDLSGALDMYKKSLAIKNEIGDRVGMISTYSNLGVIQAQLTQYGDGFSSFRKGLEMIMEIKLPHTNPGFLGNLAKSLMFAQRWEDATIVMGASQLVFDSMGQISKKDKKERDTWLSELKQHVRPDQFSILWIDGYSAKELDAIKLAISILEKS